ncbi:hypothetical protein AAKU61_000496 [Undibacterium sp. GrIS 1.2]|uniref:hypothetical protein n=1 Tax=Undibacterium sp. GrIS 1.2 TaxID=3143933 RepID=UPI003393E19C
MAWTDAYQYAGKIFGKHSTAVNGSATQNQGTNQADANLPLKARIGGVLQLQKTPFIRAISQGSLIVMPDDGNCLIRAISRVRLEIAGSLYRYYLNTGDQDANESFVQLYQNEQGDISEVMYYQRLTRFIPETIEDQQAFSGEAGAGLGDRTYTLWRAQLETQLVDNGLDAATSASNSAGNLVSNLDSVFGDGDQIDYSRDAGDPDKEFVAPFKAQESRIDDAIGQHGLLQDIVFMPYSRALDSLRESLLICTEIVRSRDGDTSRREIHVDFMVGIPVELDRLLIQ